MERLSVDPGTGPDTQYDTKYQRSLRHYLTREALPTEANYRDISSIHDGQIRPTLDELHDATFRGPQEGGGDGTDVEEAKLKGKVIKFGWIQGVLMRCMLNIWGVMLFLRVSWMVGQCGLVEALVVVCFGNLVTTITAISMSAVATNGLIQGGGVYYMISRSLGPEFGGSIGLMFTIANAIAVATYIIGFVESLQDMLFFYFDGLEIIDHGKNDIRAVGSVVLVLLLGLAIVGMEWVTRVQMALLFLLILSQIDIFIGVFIGPIDDESISQGFVGMNSDLFTKNIWSDYRKDDGSDQNFISVFAVFFTAVTGIVAGANLSGDLKDPGTAIPKGTLLAIAITFVSYMIYPFLLAAAVTRDASGNVDDLLEFMNSSEYINGEVSILDSPTFSTASCSMAGEGVENPIDPNITTCGFGLENSSQVMELISIWGPLIYAGCFAATLSSAIASLVGAPRILQALAKDKLYPGLYSFSKGYGANNDPVRGYLLVCVVTLACIMIASLNAVSTLLSNFFLASYSLINFSCFHASFIKSPGWRPSFKYFNMWVSLSGGILCLIVMFLIDYITALITFIITISLYLFVSYRKPDVNWGSSTQGQMYVSALKSTIDLQTVEEHVKNYRPQILILSGQPSCRPPLIDFGKVITKDISMLSCGHVVKNIDTKLRGSLIRRNTAWLSKNNYRSFYNLVEADNLENGSVNLFQLVGLGKLKPNMVLLGLKVDWNTCDREELKSYFNTLHAAFNMQLGIAILRVGSGLDYSDIVEDEGSAITEAPVNAPLERTLGANLDNAASKKKKHRGSMSNLYHGPGGVKLSPEIIQNITVFKRKQTTGTIDVWWLYDDGGLTLLLPYILTTRSQWSNCSLRIFALANRKDELDVEQRSMANLLSKFRIDYSDVIVIPDAMRKAKDSSRLEFDDLISDFKTKENIGDGCTITDGELSNQKDKINRHLRLRELLVENSMKSNLIVMTLPMPRKTHVSAALYMAWLDYISKGMPPFLFVRGNQQSVLTFYS